MRLGVIGYGNIGQALVGELARAPRLGHLCVLARPAAVAGVREHLAGPAAGVAREWSVVSDAEALLAREPDFVVECAGHEAVAAHAPAILRAGIDVAVVSVGALADAALEAELRLAAGEGGSRIVLPAGAIGGIDLLSALAAAGGLAVTYRGSKPPAAWAGTPAARTHDLAALSEATVIFSGNAREAAMAFPKNANVAAALALAGAGFEATRVELVADPAAAGNVHEYSVVSPLASYSIRIEGAPSQGNARTSASTVFSVLREIRNRRGPVSI